MKNAQKKTSDAQIRANKKYANSKWRPNIYIDMDRRNTIEEHIAMLGYKSFNEYVLALIDQDMQSADCSCDSIGCNDENGADT